VFIISNGKTTTIRILDYVITMIVELIPGIHDVENGKVKNTNEKRDTAKNVASLFLLIIRNSY